LLFAGTDEAGDMHGWSLIVRYQTSAGTPSSSVPCRSASTGHHVRGEKVHADLIRPVLCTSLLSSMLSLTLTPFTTSSSWLLVHANFSSLILVDLAMLVVFHHARSFPSFVVHL
jgi:hypothetical protein